MREFSHQPGPSFFAWCPWCGQATVTKACVSDDVPARETDRVVCAKCDRVRSRSERIQPPRAARKAS